MHLENVRSVFADGQRWYLAYDVCRALGYKPGGGRTRSAMWKLKAEGEARTMTRSAVEQGASALPARGMLCLTEEGATRLDRRRIRKPRRGNPKAA